MIRGSKKGYQQNGGAELVALRIRETEARDSRKNDGKPESRDERKGDIIPTPAAITDAQD